MSPELIAIPLNHENFHGGLTAALFIKFKKKTVERGQGAILYLLVTRFIPICESYGNRSFVQLYQLNLFGIEICAYRTKDVGQVAKLCKLS